MCAALWVFLSWILIFGWHPPVQSQSASYGPSLNLLYVSVGIGIVVGWPLLRLSGRPVPRPAMQAALDGFALFMLLQIVVWPLRLVTAWTLSRTLALDAAIAAAIAMTGALLALWAGRAEPAPRASAMATFVLLAMAAPLARWFGGLDAPPWPVESISPPALLSRFSAPKPLDPDAADFRVLETAGWVAAALWIAVPAALALRARRAVSHPNGDPLS